MLFFNQFDLEITSLNGRLQSSYETLFKVAPQTTF